MILGLYQTTQPDDVEAGLATIEAALSAAAQTGTDMLVLPETFLPGYTAVSQKAPDGWSGLQGQLSKACKRHRVALTIGLPDYAKGQVFNAACVIGADGVELARYRKLQLFGPDEKALYAPGDAYVTFEYKGTCFGLLICYDVEFPEHVRNLARMGAEVILVPTANMMPYVNVSQIMLPSRAAENGVTIVYANYCGGSGDLDYVGLSAIFGPDGYPLAAKGQGEGLCIAEMPDGWSEHNIPTSTQISDFRPV